MVHSAPHSLYHLLMYYPTDPLADAVLTKHWNAVLIWDLPSLDPSLSRATGSLITTNIRNLVPDHRAARLEA